MKKAALFAKLPPVSSVKLEKTAVFFQVNHALRLRVAFFGVSCAISGVSTAVLSAMLSGCFGGLFSTLLWQTRHTPLQIAGCVHSFILHSPLSIKKAAVAAQ
jgi:hypothetical protein